MRSCREFVDRLGDYVSGEQPRAARAPALRHLLRCRACSAYARSYRATLRLARSAYPGAERIAEGHVAAIVRAVRAAPRGYSRGA